eukprot:CAMPEP_0114501072 /NCGR_PEP_ID=MMETSP0109-20121206/8300_1 /TAXON_ID=29199 /ORGANISM="Chlorarachnion reptans, Strain CCCM449" /LENGTH=801 /DNA_ID=CAMNT_0001678771 /DNA_START=12 /DNA_END=2418 /DNA_ORIENTATION=-
MAGAEAKVGDRVTISGLQENKQFNGLSGTVKGKRKGRYEVFLDNVKISLLLKPTGNGVVDSGGSADAHQQESFEQVRLVRKQALQTRRRAKEFVEMISKPFDELTSQEDTAKFCLFLQEGKRNKGGDEMYLMSALPPATQRLPLKTLVLIIEYSDFRITRLSVQKRGRDLFNFINVRRELSINSGASLQQLTAEKLVQEKVRSKLRNSFGTLTKPDEPADVSNDNEGDWDWEWEDEDGEGEDDDGAGFDPSDTNKKAKEVIPAGLSYLELGILLECLGCFYLEIAGSPWKENDTAVEVVDVSKEGNKPAKTTAATSIAGKGYTGNEGETKEIARRIELKKLEDLVRDQVSGIMMGAICITLNDLLTAEKLDSPHLELLLDSCINPILGIYLRNTFMQISERQELYLNLLKAVEVLANDQKLCSLLFVKRPRHSDLHALLMGLKQQVALFLKSPNKGTEKETVELVQSAQEVDRILATVDLQTKAYLKNEKKKNVKSGKKLTEKEKEELEAKALSMRMRKLAIDFIDLQNSPIKHKFLTDSKSSPGSAKLSSRLTKEVGSMMSGLPPGIFVRVDNKRMDLMRVCINGPEGSPYQHGMFFFDVFFPFNYPAVPPKMKIITTGRATFRFNANLYTNGKVCLSLLGTWQGPGWEPSYSNLQQVLISIQAMILGIDEPIANEPGWERDRGSERSRKYNSILSHGTMLYAMYEHIKKPPHGFEEPVKLHFWEKKEFLLEKQLPKWEAEIAKAGPSAGGPYGRENAISENIKTTAKNLKNVLKSLKAPEGLEAIEEEDEEEESDQDDF